MYWLTARPVVGIDRSLRYQFVALFVRINMSYQGAGIRIGQEIWEQQGKMSKQFLNLKIRVRSVHWLTAGPVVGIDRSLRSQFVVLFVRIDMSYQGAE